ncbi:MAG: HAD-IA family hydrolase [Candidatus Limnocylindrales bacterium]
MDAMIFDWDGTLVDSLPAITRTNAEVLDLYGVAYDEAAYRAAYTPDWRTMYRQLGVPSAKVEEAGGHWVERYRALMTEVLPFPDVHLALERLALAGHPIGIVTAGDRLVVEYQLQATGLGAYVEVLVCGDDLPFSKPHPAPLLKALEELGIVDRPSDVTYIGDAPDDMRMARTVGARGIGIVSMLGLRRDLHDAGAAEVADSVTAWVAAHLARSGSRMTPGRG